MLGDPAVAISVLEETAASVSRALVRKPVGGRGIDNLPAYLFRAFLRRLNRTKRRELRVMSASQDSILGAQHSDFARELEMKVLVDELLSRCDASIRDMFFRRVQGFSWKEIGTAYGISTHAAEARFSQALRRIRKRLGYDEGAEIKHKQAGSRSDEIVRNR
jgi:DNA-directed RNA polymerase specialized sigma24 family protein